MALQSRNALLWHLTGATEWLPQPQPMGSGNLYGYGWGLVFGNGDGYEEGYGGGQLCYPHVWDGSDTAIPNESI